jgi:hypothetical protein
LSGDEILGIKGVFGVVMEAVIELVEGLGEVDPDPDMAAAIKSLLLYTLLCQHRMEVGVKKGSAERNEGEKEKGEGMKSKMEAQKNVVQNAKSRYV